MAPPFSSSDYLTTSSGEDLKINSTHIINGTITGSDIATGGTFDIYALITFNV